MRVRERAARHRDADERVDVANAAEPRQKDPGGAAVASLNRRPEALMAISLARADPTSPPSDALTASALGETPGEAGDQPQRRSTLFTWWIRAARRFSLTSGFP